MQPDSLASAQNTPSNGVVEASPAPTQFTSQGHARPNSTSNHAITVWGCNARRPPRGGCIRPSQAPAPPSFSVFQSSALNNNWNPRSVGGYIPVYGNHCAMSQRINYDSHMCRNGVHQNNGSYGNGRNLHMPLTPYSPPQPVRACGNPMFHQNSQPLSIEASPLGHYRGRQFVSHYPNNQPIPPPHVSTSLVYQINYYFCDANLVGDWFLKSHMDDQGWVSIDVVANFPRVKKLTDDIQLVLDSLKASNVVEVLGDKIRRRNEWIKWIPNKNPKLTHSLPPSESSQDLPTNFQNLKIEEGVN